MTDSRGLVVALPPAGGGTGMFAPLRKALPDGVTVVVPDLPGRGRRMRQPPGQTVDRLVAELAAELAPRLARQPYVVFAACFGTVIALELVWHIIDRELPRPRALLVSGRHPPQTAPAFEPLAEHSDEEILDRLGQSWPSGSAWHQLPETFRALMVRQVRMDNDLGLGHRHVPRGPLPIPVRVYHGIDDPELTVEDLAGWSAHTAEPLPVRLVPGGHYFFMHHVDELAEGLTAALASPPR
ncbi:thioesterase II family protein [Micromonospora echinofusca]|uniref:thioesterase II family protein n=1 Tax=Micromonospora echinofusca TaxID=47858 RepID=UPI0033DC7818